jgi:hypothetical protein
VIDPCADADAFSFHFVDFGLNADGKVLCGCKSKGDYFVAGVEYAQLQLHFEFQVVYSGGSSKFVHDYDADLLVRVLKHVDNKHADVDAGVRRNVYKEFPPGSNIIMSARDWLEAAGVVLDAGAAGGDAAHAALRE